MQYWTPAGNINVDFGPTLEEWTHVAVIVNADGMHVYANGEQIGTAGGGGPVSSGDTFNMGGDGVYDATGNWFLGSIDDVAVWNRSWSFFDGLNRCDHAGFQDIAFWDQTISNGIRRIR